MIELKNISPKYENTGKGLSQNIPLQMPLLSDVVVTIFQIKLQMGNILS